MCYTVLLIEEYCPRNHELAKSMCWRQCKAQAAKTALRRSERRDWTSLCPRANSRGNPAVVKSKYAVQSPHCHICLDLEADPRFQVLRTAFDQARAAFQEAQAANDEHESSRTRLTEQRLSPDLTRSQKDYIDRMINYHDQANLASLLAQERYKTRLDETQGEIDEFEIESRRRGPEDPVMDRTLRRVYAGGPADEDERAARYLHNNDFPEHFASFDECNPENYPHRVLYYIDELAEEIED